MTETNNQTMEFQNKKEKKKKAGKKKYYLQPISILHKTDWFQLSPKGVFISNS